MNYLPHQQRVVDEKTELDVKLHALDAFFDTPRFISLPGAEMTRMTQQAEAMQRYSDILGQRIAAFPSE